ncbi:hypothetical protein COLO4_05144 [Corchorus olitorius]|uniref:Uncharacterized protein n=1 Tax=Corchorus olitorius TaxID=93759 RepID=A0A1R3KRQ6_9ROSI|nr:hypothetical protein COLO4_05144 [Corchorus olitorius]
MAMSILHYNNKEVEVALALISGHPTQNSFAVAIWLDLCVFNLLEDCAVNLVNGSGMASHNDLIRAIRYGANGKLFVFAGDDKLVKVLSSAMDHGVARQPFADGGEEKKIKKKKKNIS